MCYTELLLFEIEIWNEEVIRMCSDIENTLRAIVACQGMYNTSKSIAELDCDCCDLTAKFYASHKLIDAIIEEASRENSAIKIGKIVEGNDGEKSLMDVKLHPQKDFYAEIIESNKILDERPLEFQWTIMR